MMWSGTSWSDPLSELAWGCWGPALLAWKVRGCCCLAIVLERGMSPEWEKGRPQHSYCLDPLSAQEKWIRLSSHLGLMRSLRWDLSAPAALSWRAGVPGHAAISWNIMWWAELGQVGGSNCAGGWCCHQRRHWDRAGIGKQGGIGEAGWDTSSCIWDWGDDPWHPQLSGGGSIQASWCVLGHPGAFWGIPAHCPSSHRAALRQCAVPPRDRVRAGAAAGRGVRPSADGHAAQPCREPHGAARVR